MAPGDDDIRWLLYAIALSRRSLESGDYAYGAVVVGANNVVLAEGMQTVATPSDPLGHAETNALRQLFPRFVREQLAGATMYSSTEPCPTCTGAIAWCMGRLVYGLSQASMYELYSDVRPRFVQPWACRTLLSNVSPPMQVIGPLLEPEAAAAHDAWLARQISE